MGLLAALAVLLVARPVRAEGKPVLVAEPSALPDVRAEAFALALHLRAQLEAGVGAPAAWDELGQRPEQRPSSQAGPDAAARQLVARLGAGAILLLDVEGEGLTLVVRVRLVGADGAVISAGAFRGSRKDVIALGRAVGGWAAQAAKITARNVDVSFGELWPYAEAAAALARKDLAGAATVLLGASVRAAERMPALAQVARAVWSDARRKLPERLDLASRLAPPVDALGMIDDARSSLPPEALIVPRARTLLRMGKLVDAELELKKAKTDDDAVRLLRAEILHALERPTERNQALLSISDLGARAVLRFVVELRPGVLPVEVEDRVLVGVVRHADDDPALASAIGERALQSGASPTRTLGLIGVEFMTDPAARQLADALGKLPEGSGTLRLRAELRARAGQVDLALADADAALAGSPGDAGALRLRGQLRVAKGDFAAGAKDFEAAAGAGSSRARVEQVRALELGGDAKGALDAAGGVLDKVQDLRLRADVELAAGRHDAARKLLEEARKLAPADVAVKKALARTLKLGGDIAGADALDKELAQQGTAETVTPSPLLAQRLPAVGQDGKPVTAAPAPVGDDRPSGPFEPSAASLAQARHQDDVQPLVDRVSPLLEAFADLGTPGRRVVLVPLDSREAWYWPWQVAPARLRDALDLALSQQPYNQLVNVGPVPPAEREPLTRERLEAAARAGDAELVVLYGISAVGNGKAKIKLVTYRRGSVDVQVVDETFAGGRALGLLGWNSGFYMFWAGILGVLVLFGLALAIRGWGTALVKIKRDPAVLEDAYCVRVAKTSEPPLVDDLSGFGEKLRKAGARTEKRFRALAGGTSSFEGLPAGAWYVHVWGTHQKGGELRALPRLTQQITIRRGKTTEVEFNLVPNGAEYRIAVFDGEIPVVGAKLWLDDAEKPAAVTNAEGLAFLDLPKGRRVVRIQAGDLKLEKTFDVNSTKIVTLTINLVRERSAQDLKGGVTLDGADASSAGQMVPGAASLAGGTSDSAPRVGAQRTQAPVAVLATMASGSQQGPPAATGAVAKNLGLSVGSQPGQGGDAAPGRPSGVAQAVVRYQRVAELGRGAMGVVYRARDSVLERDVAMKVISDEVRRVPQALEFFMQEARALAALNHPNIVAVYDQGYDEDGHAFMVMEWVEGTTLENVLERAGGKLQLRQVLGLAKQLCDGIGFAHGKRVVHRDIKPANIFVSADGRVKVGDFGLAKVMRELQIQRTEIRGTPLYMAPEQIFGTDIDHRADLYAIACTLFECLTGQPPFLDGDVLYHHVHSPPPAITSMNADLPPTLDAVFTRCLAKNKAERYASAEEFLRALAAAVQPR